MRFCAVLCLLLLTGCGKPAGWHEETRLLYYGIPVSVKFFPADQQLASEVWQVLESVDVHFNDYKQGTEVSRLNAAASGKPLAVSADMAEALQHSFLAFGLTEGAFDITMAPIRKLWKACAQSGNLPGDEAIAAAVQASGMEALELKEQTLTKHAERTLDFGGIIKGIAVDRALALLQRGGATSAFVQVGGETGVFGLSRRAEPFRLGIQHPLDETTLWGAIEAPQHALSLSTSGNYRQPVQVGDKTYYHIFDPRTGQPADTHVLSVSVVFAQSGRNGLADALATAGAVLGKDLLPIAVAQGAEALVILSEGGEPVAHATAGWQAMEVQLGP